MAYVVDEGCIGCRWGDCVRACPQQAFRQGPNSVAIDAQACANCGLCALVCPELAIHPDYALADAQRYLVALNRELAASWPPAVATQPMADAPQWSGRSGKGRWLQR